MHIADGYQLINKPLQYANVSGESPLPNPFYSATPIQLQDQLTANFPRLSVVVRAV